MILPRLPSLPLPGADLAYQPAWMASRRADALFAQLLEGIDWQQHHVRLFGRRLPSPRLSCWIGEPGATYRYSGARFRPRPWPDMLTPVREQVEQATGARFNSVLANLYRDGTDAMGWHSDDEPELGPAPVIASLSLGAERRFILRSRRGDPRRLVLRLGHGSLLRMAGPTQSNYRHALPRCKAVAGARINLTFRAVHDVPPRAP